MTKEITIEDLARMVQKGFNETNGRIDAFENKVDERLGKVETQLVDLNHMVDQIDRRLFSIEEDMAEIKTKKHKELEKRVTFIEHKLGIEGVR